MQEYFDQARQRLEILQTINLYRNNETLLPNYCFL